MMHVSAKHGQDMLVKNILSNPRFEKLLNERDKNGRNLAFGLYEFSLKCCVYSHVG